MVCAPYLRDARFNEARALSAGSCSAAPEGSASASRFNEARALSAGSWDLAGRVQRMRFCFNEARALSAGSSGSCY